MRGKFLRITDEIDRSFEQVLSKWYYELELDCEQEIFIGVHQEDERIQGVIDRRPFIDVGFSVIQVNQDTSYDLVDYLPLVKDRQAEMQFNLGPGKYIILPRTTGGLLKYKNPKF